MDMSDVFNADLYVGNITDLGIAAKVVRDLGVFNTAELKRAFNMLAEHGFEEKINIGVKKLMMICEMSRQDTDKVDKFVVTMVNPPHSYSNLIL